MKLTSKSYTKHNLLVSTSQLKFQIIICNLLIAKFKINIRASQNTNIHSVNTDISKSLIK